MNLYIIFTYSSIFSTKCTPLLKFKSCLSCVTKDRKYTNCFGDRYNLIAWHYIYENIDNVPSSLAREMVFKELEHSTFLCGWNRFYKIFFFVF